MYYVLYAERQKKNKIEDAAKHWIRCNLWHTSQVQKLIFSLVLTFPFGMEEIFSHFHIPPLLHTQKQEYLIKVGKNLTGKEHIWIFKLTFVILSPYLSED